MPSTVTPAIPAGQLVNVVPSVLGAGGQPLQFWGFILDANLGANGYPLMPMGEVLLFADTADLEGYFGDTSQEAGLGSVYFTGPVNATVTPSGILMAQYALNAVPAYLRSGSLANVTLGELQALDASLTISVDGTPITETINLATATSFSNAATLIGSQLGIKGIQVGEITASLSTTTMTVSALVQGPEHAVVTANLSGSTMTVTAITGGYLQVGDVVSGTGITVGTTIASWNGGGVPGGVGSYTLSENASSETAVTVTSYAPTPTLAIGQVVSGTGITAGTYISAFGTGTGGTGTYTLSASATTESGETVTVYSPGCSYSALHDTFDIHSGTTGTGSSVSFGTGAAATTLLLTQALGAIQSSGAAASNMTTFMDTILTQTQNWVSWMTAWELTDTDKEAAATFNNAQDNGYVYELLETNVLDTESGGPSAPVAFVNNGDLSGVEMIYTNPAITTLYGEKAAFAMGWTASLNFTALNGRATQAFKSYIGGLPDITSGTIAEILAGAPQTGTFGYGVNFYGNYTTRSQGFPQWQRGLISGPYMWKDSYVDQIWLNNALQEAIMEGLTTVNSVPYNTDGAALIESWCLDPILAAVNFGAIVAGVTLSQAQQQEVNQMAGVIISGTLTQRGWYLQVSNASAATRAIRASPPCTLFYCDGGAIQAVDIASIEIM
jgi:hypothetical protein